MIDGRAKNQVHLCALRQIVVHAKKPYFSCPLHDKTETASLQNQMESRTTFPFYHDCEGV